MLSVEVHGKPAAELVVHSDTRATCRTPRSGSGAGPVDVVLTTAGGEAQLPSGFTYQGIVSVEPDSGKPDQLREIVIRTAGYTWPPGPDRVRKVGICGAISSTVGYERDAITTVFWPDSGSHAKPGYGDVVLYGDDGVELARLRDGFHNLAPGKPAVIDVGPRSGPPGTEILVVGAWIREDGNDPVRVWLNNTHIATNQWRSLQNFICKIPKAPPGVYDINLYDSGKWPIATLFKAFTVT